LQILQEGDVLITNDPWDGTGHLNDFTVVTPTFQNESCIALFASTTHIADVGGLGFGPEGRNVYEEGIQIPITHLFRKGHLDETLMKIILARPDLGFVFKDSSKNPSTKSNLSVGSILFTLLNTLL